MKKILFTLLVLFFSMPAYATCWYEFCEKCYVDLDSLTKTNGVVSVWTKKLNTGNVEPVKNKKIWFTTQKMYINLKTKKLAIKEVYWYDLNGENVDYFQDEKLYWDTIAPDTVAYFLYDVVYKYPRLKKFTEKELWVNIDDKTKLDVLSLLMTNSNCCNASIIAYAKKPKRPNDKVRYVKAFLSLDLVEQKCAIIEAIEYNKKGKIVKVKKYDNLNYIRDEENSFKPIIDYILNLSKELENKKNLER
jgi:hypothetical protein